MSPPPSLAPSPPPNGRNQTPCPPPPPPRPLLTTVAQPRPPRDGRRPRPLPPRLAPQRDAPRIGRGGGEAPHERFTARPRRWRSFVSRLHPRFRRQRFALAE